LTTAAATEQESRITEAAYDKIKVGLKARLDPGEDTVKGLQFASSGLEIVQYTYMNKQPKKAQVSRPISLPFCFLTAFARVLTIFILSPQGHEQQ